MSQFTMDTQGYHAADPSRVAIGPRLSTHGIQAMLEMPRLSTIQSEVPLSDEMARRLNNEFFSLRPQVTLRLYTNGHHLRFLKHMPNVRRFSADCMSSVEHIHGVGDLPNLEALRVGIYDLTDFDFLDDLPDTLRSLALEETQSKRPSLTKVERLRELKVLMLGGQQKQIEVVGRLPQLRHIGLGSISSPGLDFLGGANSLKSLRIVLGGIQDISALKGLPNLEYLCLNWVRGLADISPVSELTRLRCLRLELLKRITSVPNLQKLASLRRLVLIQMNSLTDLDSVCSAKALEELLYIPGKKFRAADFDFIYSLPNLKRAAISFGSLARNAEFRAVAESKGLDTRWDEDDLSLDMMWGS